MRAVKPPRLRPGDLIGLVSPAGIPRPAEKIQLGARYLESRGYRVLVGKHAAREHGYLAGTDEERAEDLNAMIRDSRVKAIFASRGGYGSQRIVSAVDFDALRQQPKIVSGFSDITGLQLAIWRRCKLVTFSGPMPAVEFRQPVDPYTEERFWRLLVSGECEVLNNPPELPPRTILPGTASGVLLGGNLALVAATLGTTYCPSFRNSILVLEDVGEEPYRVDRMLTQLRNAGVCPSGVAFGKFTLCAPKDPQAPSFTIPQLQDDFARRLNVPAIAELQYGHVPKKLTVPFGVRARLDPAVGTIQMLEPAVT